jgi:hypothetical protein
MTVEELITLLQEFPKDAPLLVTGCYGAITDDILGLDLVEDSPHGPKGVYIKTDLMTG